MSAEPLRAAVASSRYERPINLASDSTHARIAELVGRGQRVLELAPATEQVSEALHSNGCEVVTIEFDPEQLEFDQLGEDRFDVILAADVLAQLKDPLDALRRVRPFLRDGGSYVISVPNVAHASVRLALLAGHSPYGPAPLLDRDHVHFFTRESVSELLHRAELAITTIDRQDLEFDASEIGFAPAGWLEALAEDPDARAARFVISAAPVDTPGLQELQRRTRELALENERLRAELRAEDEAAATASRERETQLRTALIDVHDQLLQRDEQLFQLGAELKLAREQQEIAIAETATLREVVLRLKLRLDRIHGSAPFRMYNALRDLPGFRSIVKARTDTYWRELERAENGSEPPYG